jgi:hypothetical protein
MLASPPTLGVLFIEKLKTTMPLWAKTKITFNVG